MQTLTKDSPLSDWFEKFLKERRYDEGVSDATVIWYRQAWGLFDPQTTLSLADLTTDRLKEFAYLQLDRKVKPITVNSRGRALNCFMRWLFLRKLLEEQPRYVPDKGGKRVIPTLKVDTIKTLVTFKPMTWHHQRIHAMTVALLDTGCRIHEIVPPIEAHQSQFA